MEENAGRQHPHHAVEPPFVSDPAKELGPKNPGSAAGRSDRTPIYQGADLHDVRQPDSARPRELRLGSGVAILFRQTPQGTDAARSRAPGRPAAQSLGLLAV